MSLPYLRKEKAFVAVFPNEKAFDVQKMLYAMSFLLQSIRQYLLIDGFENDDLHSPIYLLQAFRQRGMNHFFEKTLKEALFNLDARRMLMRIYYDFEEWSALASLIDSTKIYIQRQKNMGYGREHYWNLTCFLQKMLKSDLKDPKKRALLRGEVETEKSVAEKEWLLEKLK